MTKQHWQDWINGMLGLWVFGSPWFLEHTMVTEVPARGTLGMWNLWVIGLAVVVIAGFALYAFNAWKELANLILGVWLVASPWALGFSTSDMLMRNAVSFGALIVFFAAWALYDATRGPNRSAK